MMQIHHDERSTGDTVSLGPIHPSDVVENNVSTRTGVIQVARRRRRRRPLGSEIRAMETTTQQSQEHTSPLHYGPAIMDDGDYNNEYNEDDEEDSIPLFPCRVSVQPFAHGSSSCHPRKRHWQDKVQSFPFQDFEGLEEFMRTVRPKILQRHPATLQLVHEKFQAIVQEIVHSQTLFSSVLQPPVAAVKSSNDEQPQNTEAILIDGDGHDTDLPCDANGGGGWSTTVGTFATPNVRLKRGTYATFLHADAIYPPLQTNSTYPKAMINIWMSLSDQPIANFPLCFYSCPRTETTFAENKLYYTTTIHNDDDDDDCNMENNDDKANPTRLELLYDPNLTWGSFLCFVAGESVSLDHVLLHGAVNLDQPDDDTGHSADATPTSHPQSSKKRLYYKEEPRKSLEMRFVV